jgi:hypothetical protein
MPISIEPHISRGREDQSATFFDRVRGNSGALITQASFTAITYKVFDRAGTEVATGTVTIGSSVFDTLQTSDAAWTAAGGSSTGYNFKHTIPASAFANPGRYRVEYKFDPTSGDDFFLVFDHECAGIRTS